MLNEIISITNSGDMFSGIGRSQSLKDGAFVGLGQFTDDIDPQQKDFMSVLSQFGKGAVQVMPEESKNANSKLAEGRLPNEVNADNASSEKPKGKQGKDGSVAKRLPSVYPDTLGLVMGFLSIPNMPQSDISANTAFNTLSSESEENPASGLIAGGSTPETMKNQQLPDESIILTGIQPIPTSDLSGSDIAQAAQIEASPKLQGQQQPDTSSVKGTSINSPAINGPAIKGTAQVLQGGEVPAQQQENTDSVTVSNPVFSRLDSAQFFKGEPTPKLQVQRQSDTSSVKGTSISSPAINSPAINSPTIKGTAQVLQGGEVPAQQQNPDSVTVSNPVFSRLDSVQFSKGELTPKIQVKRQTDTSSVKGTSINSPAINGPAKGTAQVLQGGEMTAQQQANPDSVTVSDPLFSRLDSVQFFNGDLTPKLQGQSQPDTSSVKDTSINGPAIKGISTNSPAIKGTTQVLQGGEVPAQQQENPDSVSVKVSDPVFSRLDSVQFFNGELTPKLQVQRQPDTSSVKGSSMIDSAQFFKGDLTPKLQGQSQPDTSSVKDTSINGPAIKGISTNSPAIKGTTQVLQGGEVPAQQQENPVSVSVKVSDPVFSRLDSAQLFNGELTPKLQVQRQTDTSSVKGTSTNGPEINSPAIKGTAQILQGGETPAQQQENSVSITASDPFFSRLDSVQFFNGELTPKLQVQRRSDSSSVKGTSINSPAINDPAIKGTPQILQSADMPAQQQENPDSVTASDPVFSKLDTVQLNLSTGKENLGAKGNITQENSADSVFQNTSERDKAPVVQKSSTAARPQEVKAKSGSFHQTGNAIETDGVASPSATVSNADSVGTMDSKSSNSLDTITGSDDGPQLQPPEPASGGSVANFAREGQTEKTSSVNLSSNETRPVNQSFHTEVVKQVVDKTASTLKSGQSEMQIDLKPESLGHLRLHVSMENQQVTVKILAENTQVKEMIERQASLIKIELQHQGIKVDSVNVDMLMSGGTDFASSHHEETAFKQARHEPAYSKGQDSTGESGFKEPDSPSQANSRGGNLVNYFA